MIIHNYQLPIINSQIIHIYSTIFSFFSQVIPRACQAEAKAGERHYHGCLKEPIELPATKMEVETPTLW